MKKSSKRIGYLRRAEKSNPIPEGTLCLANKDGNHTALLSICTPREILTPIKPLEGAGPIQLNDRGIFCTPTEIRTPIYRFVGDCPIQLDDKCMLYRL